MFEQPARSGNDCFKNCLHFKGGDVWAYAEGTHVLLKFEGPALKMEETTAQITDEATICEEESKLPINHE